MVLVFLRLLFALPATFVWAKEDPARFEVKCKASVGEFELLFQSKSGEVSEDDMSVRLRQEKKEVQLPLHANWYQTAGAIRDRKKLPGICRIVGSADHEYDYPAFEISPSRVLIFFRLNGRPGFSRVSAIIYDPKTKSVIAQEEDIATIKDRNMAFRAISGGVEQRMVRHWLKNTGCDCSESAIEDWNPIRVNDKKIRLGWQAKVF
jgi:hypothetical protein